MIITISGMPGSGKTLVGRLLAEKLGYAFYSVGDLRGRIAMEMEMTIDDLNELGKREDWTDRKVDEKIKKLAERNENMVVDGWVAFHFIPHSFKVFLEVDGNVAAERVFRDQRKDEKKVQSVAELSKVLQMRVMGDKIRWKRYYGIDFLDRKNYDIVIDTTHLKPAQVVDKIAHEVGKG